MNGNHSTVHPSYLSALEYRLAGPFRGGRSVAVAGDSKNPLVFYNGATAGGVWKTTDAGLYWENVSDGFFNTAAVGAIAVSDSDPNVVYVGTGESCFRADATHGDGVYKTTDGGKTWQNMGLRDTRHIARIRIHPTDPNVAYVAAAGHEWGSNPERGVFRTRDGGKTWEHVLFKSDKAGAIDLSMDPSNPRILYAAIFQVLRQPWTMTSGGPDSGLYKSTDGGDTWVEITQNPGLPQGLKGRIGVAISPPRPERVWALMEIENSQGGLFRSDDSGATWQKISDKPEIYRRPWYYTHVFADTQDPDTCYCLDVQFWKSNDGGRTFFEMRLPHGDHHDVWLDPRNNQRLISGSDGGASVSLDGGASWSMLYNQPTASLFKMDVDNQFPYNLYATQMDNTAIKVPSRGDEGAIPWKDCDVVGNSESGYIAVKPNNPNIIFSGANGSAPGGGGTQLCYHMGTRQTRIVHVWPHDQSGSPVKDIINRFYFTYPTVFSPHDPDLLYCCSQYVYKSTDDGGSWERISPDLSRNDQSKMQVVSGGLSTDSGGTADFSGVIFAFAVSPSEPGVLWAGSDDGLVHITRDGGGSWENVTPQDLPEWTLVYTIEPSRHDPATAYLAATRYKLHDHSPYVFKTSDYGKTWRKITNGIPDEYFTRVIREDPAKQGLLYLGTELGMFVSFDDGDHWQPIQGNLPVVPIHDMAVKNNDLIAATHGRSFWILDDLTPLQQISDGVTGSDAHLFKPRSTYRIAQPMGFGRGGGIPGKDYQRINGETVTFYEKRNEAGEVKRVYLNAGQNPPDGVPINYYLKNAPDEGATIAILDSNDNVINTFKRSPKAGMNKLVWNMRYPPTAGPDARGRPAGISPLVPPGTYQVRLTVDGQTFTESFELLKDPRVSATKEDLTAQFDLLVQVRDKLVDNNTGLSRLRSVRSQVDEWVGRAGGEASRDVLSTAAQAIKDKLWPIEDQLASVHEPYAQTVPPVRLDAKLMALSQVVAAGDFGPTQGQLGVYDELSGLVDHHLQELQQIIDQDVAGFVEQLNELGVPAIVP